MKVIITGAGGFLGHALIRKLSTIEDIYIYALTTQCERLKKEFQEYLNVSVCNNAEINNEINFSNYDVLINCAFPRQGNGEQFAEGLKYVKETLSTAVQHGIGAIINISSQSVYSQCRSIAATEQQPISLDSMYAVGKYATELFTEIICKDCPFCNIRMASLIGPEFDQRVVNKMIDSALTTGTIYVQNDKQYFGFLDIEDAVNGLWSILKIPYSKWNTIYNLGGEKAYTLLDIALTISDIIESVMMMKVEIKIMEGDTKRNTALDCSLLENTTGYKPSISLSESINRILKVKLQNNNSLKM